MKVLELFSGIGGMHFACQDVERLSNTNLDFNVITAVDINTSANSVYRCNFPETKLVGGNIQALSVDSLAALCPDMVLMSPPCQPFTRVGLKKDISDARCDALAYLIETLPHIPSLQYVLLENVKGFELSQSRKLFTEMLSNAGFKYQELLLSPTQLGIPNSRTRYYLIAKKCDNLESGFCFETTDQLITAPPKLKPGVLLNPSLHMSLQSILESTNAMDPLYQKYRLPDKDLVRRFNVLDIVSSRQGGCTNCFTKAYTHYAEGTGSVLSNLPSLHEVDRIIEKAKALLQDYLIPTNSVASEVRGKKRKIEKDCKIREPRDNFSTDEEFHSETRGHNELKRTPEKCSSRLEASANDKEDVETESIARDEVTSEEKISSNVGNTSSIGDTPILEKEDLQRKILEDTTKVCTTENTELSVTVETGKETREDERRSNKGEIISGKRSKEENTISKKGSVIESDDSTTLSNLTSNTRPNFENAALLQDLSKLNLRYFSPREISKLMCFPENFKFPADCSDRSRYKLLGNSINVRVVAYCICLMLL